MKTLLVNPPHANPTSPPLGLAVLCAYLRELGQVVEVQDLGIRTIRHLLDGPTVEETLDRARQEIDRLEEQDALTYPHQRRYLALVEAALLLEHCRDRIPTAISIQRDPARFGDPEKRSQAHWVINSVLESIGRITQQAELNAGEYRRDVSPFSTEDIHGVLRQGQDHLWGPFFASWASSIEWDDVGVLGISISYAKQLIPSLLLATAIRERSPDTWIVLGGSLLAHMNDRHVSKLLDHCDAIVRCEGETTLAAIVTARKFGKQMPQGIGALCRARDGTVPPPGVPHPIDIDRTPCPDFRDFPLDLYLSPCVVLPLQASRGCYWGKCAFCCLPAAFQDRGRLKGAANTAADMETLRARHGVRHFEFVDDALSPAYALDLAREIEGRHIDAEWFCYGRFDPEFSLQTLRAMKASGCQSIKFGLESASEPVLRRMGKGIRVETARRVLADAKAAGIVPQVAFFTGFPGERAVDVERTLSFVAENALDRGVVAYNGQFRLLQAMDVFRHPESFGVRKVEKWNFAEDLIDYFTVECDEGPSRQEAIETPRTVMKKLSRLVRWDFPRTVDLRRLFFLPLESVHASGASPGHESAWRFVAPFDVTAIRLWSDLTHGDFVPGEGVYRERSHVMRNAHCDLHLRSLERSIAPLPRGPRNAYYYDPGSRAFSQRGDFDGGATITTTDPLFSSCPGAREGENCGNCSDSAGGAPPVKASFGGG